MPIKIYRKTLCRRPWTSGETPNSQHPSHKFDISACAAQGRIRLHVSAAGERAEYVVLSYC